jgi:amidase
MSALVFLPAHQLAKAIRDRTVSSLEILEAYLNQISQHNPQLNAIATLDEERATEQAKAADAALARGEIWGALHGVPITIKDTLETAGLRTTSSHQPLADYFPRQDATAVIRLRNAGAVILGKTNPAKLAGDYQSNSPVFGRANNPWDLNRTPGGSTGGGGAAVAAGLSPLELGSDIGGSIRVPAHFCGVFGLKPTDRLVPTNGHIPELPGMSKSIRHMLTVGPLARSVEDLRLCLSLISGADDRQPEIPPVPLENPTERSLKDYRFVWTDQFGDVPVTAETRSTLHKLVEVLTNLGCCIEQHNPPNFDFNAAWETYGTVSAFEVGAAQPLSFDAIRLLLTYEFYERTQTQNKRRSPITRGFWRTATFSLQSYMTALTERDRLIALMDRFLNDWDVWLCPVATVPAFTHHPLGKPIEVDGVRLSYVMACGAYTTIFNLTGHPVVVLPVGQSKEGLLPIGVQVVGRRWKDMALLSVAEKLTEVSEPLAHPLGY